MARARESLPLRSLSFFVCKRRTSRDIILAQNFRLTEAAACAIYELVKCITYNYDAAAFLRLM